MVSSGRQCAAPTTRYSLLATRSPRQGAHRAIQLGIAAGGIGQVEGNADRRLDAPAFQPLAIDRNIIDRDDHQRVVGKEEGAGGEQRAGGALPDHLAIPVFLEAESQHLLAAAGAAIDAPRYRPAPSE